MSLKNDRLSVGELRDFYRDLNCLGVVALINYLASPGAKGLTRIGSSTIDFDGVLKDETLTDDEALDAIWNKTFTLYLGRKGGPTPLEEIEGLTKEFEKLPLLARKRFDKICGEFAKILNDISTGALDTEPIDFKDSKRDIPPSTVLQ